MVTQTLEFNKKLKYNKLSGVSFGIFRLGDARYRTSEMSWMSYLGKMCFGVLVLRPIEWSSLLKRAPNLGRIAPNLSLLNSNKLHFLVCNHGNFASNLFLRKIEKSKIIFDLAQTNIWWHHLAMKKTFGKKNSQLSPAPPIFAFLAKRHFRLSDWGSKCTIGTTHLSY